MASYPKCHPDFDPHRFDLHGNRKPADFDRKSADFDRKSADFDRKSADFDRKSAERLAQPPYFWEHPDGKFLEDLFFQLPIFRHFIF